jgi:DNA-binding GntR family transcriptional regulator
VADAIAVRKGTQVIRRHRLTSRYSRPVSLSTSWFDAALAEVAPLLLSTDRVVGGCTAYVEERTGRTVTAGRDQVTARQATDSEAADLGLPAGSPVLHGRTWFYDSSGAVMEFGEFVTVPGRWTSSDYELAAELAEAEAGTTLPGR